MKRLPGLAQGTGPNLSTAGTPGFSPCRCDGDDEAKSFKIKICYEKTGNTHEFSDKLFGAHGFLPCLCVCGEYKNNGKPWLFNLLAMICENSDGASLRWLRDRDGYPLRMQESLNKTLLTIPS